MTDLMIERSETSTVSNEGRVVIPAAMRKAMGLEAGSTVTFRLEAGELVMTTRRAAIRKLQELVRNAPIKQAGSVVDELIAERRAEAAREGAE
jgi:AbrB family looped-hinge helix DNA binding protein